MVCPECSYENLGALKKCGWCGARLDKKKREPKEKERSNKGRQVKYRPVKTRPIKNRPTRNPPLIGPVLIGVIVLGAFLVFAVFNFIRDNSDAGDLVESDIADVWYCRTSDDARMFERNQMIENFGEEFYDTLTELGLEPCE